jgi:tellurite resistance protein
VSCQATVGLEASQDELVVTTREHFAGAEGRPASISVTAGDQMGIQIGAGVLGCRPHMGWHRHGHPGRIPLNLFGIAFGLLGLADCWLVAASFGLAPVAVGDALTAIATVIWAVVLAAYGWSVASRPGRLAADVTDPVAGPFGSLAVIVPMLAVADGLYPYAAGAARVVADVLIVVTVLVGAWYTGQWLYKPLPLASIHPGYFLPTAAGGFVAAAVAALVGQPELARVLFGLGFISWVVLGSIIYGRLILGPPLPPVLKPTLTIEVAPAGVASFAYFAIYGDRIDLFVAMIGGYGLLMALAQLRLVPMYLKLTFAPSFWAFAFAWSAAVFASMFWLHAGQPSGWRAYCYLLLGAISVLVAAIAARTAVALWRGELLPVTPPPPSGPRETTAFIGEAAGTTDAG